MSEAKKYGWTGQGLRINLTTGEITKVPTQKDWIGGTALGYKIFWDEVPPKTQAFDEANKIVIAPGPLTGTGAVCSGRTSVTTMYPTTYPIHEIGSAHLGGDLGAKMKYAGYDFIVDAIDTVAPKTALLAECLLRKTPVVSSMGAGGRLDPSRCGYFDLWETREDGLARAVRQRLKKLGLRRHLPVVASTEAPRQASLIEAPGQNKRTSYGTVAAVPAVFGILLGSYVVNKLLRD